MYLITVPWLLRKLYSSNYIWEMLPDAKKLYLTFDDGPHPVVTPFVLDELRKYNAKATFFCIGKNVAAHPEIYKQIIEEGHAVGNHTYNHLNGHNTTDKLYFNDIAQAAKLIDSTLFRPPYGRITRFQAKQLVERAQFKIIMWSVLSADFDIRISPERCFKNVVKNVKPGSIIVFHDSEKAYNAVRYTLPKVLEKLSGEGYTFDKIVG